MFADDINTVLASTQEQIERLNEHTHRFAFDIVFIYLKRKLDEIPKLPVRNRLSSFVVSRPCRAKNGEVQL